MNVTTATSTASAATPSSIASMIIKPFSTINSHVATTQAYATTTIRTASRITSPPPITIPNPRQKSDPLYILPHFFQQPHRPPGGLPAPGRLPQSARTVSALTANGTPPRISTVRFPFQKRHVAQICISRRNDAVPISPYPPTPNRLSTSPRASCPLFPPRCQRCRLDSPTPYKLPRRHRHVFRLFGRLGRLSIVRFHF